MVPEFLKPISVEKTPETEKLEEVAQIAGIALNHSSFQPLPLREDQPIQKEPSIELASPTPPATPADLAPQQSS